MGIPFGIPGVGGNFLSCSKSRVEMYPKIGKCIVFMQRSAEGGRLSAIGYRSSAFGNAFLVFSSLHSHSTAAKRPSTAEGALLFNKQSDAVRIALQQAIARSADCVSTSVALQQKIHLPNLIRFYLSLFAFHRDQAQRRIR